MRNAKTLALGIAALAAASSAEAQHEGHAAMGAHGRVEVIRKDADRRVDVLVDGKPFTSYIWPTSLMKPVLYPIMASSGTDVTRGWPMSPRPGERVDHPHHVGLWLNYESVNGLDFWNNSTDIKGDRVQRMGTIHHRSIRKAEGGQGHGTLETTSEWVTPANKVLLKEDTRYVFHAMGSQRVIDRITTLTAVDDSVVFKDIKDGMLGLRVRRELEEPATKAEVFTDAHGVATPVPVMNNEGVVGKYKSSEGKSMEKEVWGTRARWTRLDGAVKGEPLTIAILDHPSNVGYPTYWHVRGYGLYAANPLGQAIFSNGKEQLNLTLKKGQSTTFRHRILVASGAISDAEIEQSFKSFSTTK